MANLSLLNVTSQGLFNLGGVPIPSYPALGLPGAELEIVNNNFPPGVVGFSATNSRAINTSNSVTLTVYRTNGNFGTIHVYYDTSDGTAHNGVNYTGSPTASSKTELTFNGGTSDQQRNFHRSDHPPIQRADRQLLL